MVHSYPKFVESSVEVFDDRAVLGCKFVASNYSNLVKTEWRKGWDNKHFIAPSEKFVQHYSWENSDCVVVELLIKSPTPEDSGTDTYLFIEV